MLTKLPHQNHSFSHHFQLLHSDDTAATNDGGGISGDDGSTIEVVRKARGRPPGSKNKPKPPVPDPSMTPCILEIQAGNDVVEAITNFSRRKSIRISVLYGYDTVSNVTLCQPSTSPGGLAASTVTFHGRFDILSLSATFLPQTTSCDNYHVPNTCPVSLAGTQGQIIGGLVAVSLSLLTGDQEEEMRYTMSTGGGGGGERHSPPLSCGGSMYNCHNLGGADVIWTLTARPPPPY